MLTSIIILANSQEEADLETKKQVGRFFESLDNLNNNPDFLLIDEPKTIKIASIRKLKQELSLRPYQEKYKVALIKNAQLLTLEAQNALLKTLEEPPGESIILLTATSKNAFLPTILSRCQIIETKKQPQSKESQQEALILAEKIIKAKSSQRLQIAATYGHNPLEAQVFCLNQLHLFKNWLRCKPNKNLLPVVKQLLETIQLLKVNVNPQLVIGNLLLSYPKSLKIDLKIKDKKGKTSSLKRS